MLHERPLSGLSLLAQPFIYPFVLAHTALLSIDMQRDFIEPGGFGASLGNDVSRLRSIVPACQTMLAAWRRAGGLVVHTRETHRADLSDCPPAKRLRGNPALRIGDVGPLGRILVAGEPGSQIIAELAPWPGEPVIDKPGKGAFHATGLQQMLEQRGISHLIVMGVTTEVCVQSTMREANDRGYDCLLLLDCTESYFPQFKTATAEMIRAQGAIVGWTANSTQLLSTLAESSASKTPI
ncbi:cysteine hydrolase [Verminephrobacter aporrectodeae subsp. tuberculatae]|uniref:cysteine hydrolase family protein n=1 Tax=Verminephrobacter aporrectodeae TaxID=1110389 RepID=UPI002243BB2B|nr:isochorismatase family cysteine hydrolase [Verminephrobacter aporrectodeae]MCW8165233.1 cysteine hydrolase [Verminephrobacter aporrectodeae subsp. tuberculatae]MCW8167833.1 cysteine hydrolase [Verminephrobacter aporrectodeae subsp. tuberculatae]